MTTFELTVVLMLVCVWVLNVFYRHGLVLNGLKSELAATRQELTALKKHTDGLCVKAYAANRNAAEDTYYSALDTSTRNAILRVLGPAHRHGYELIRKAEGNAKLADLEAERKRVLEDYPVEPPKVKP